MAKRKKRTTKINSKILVYIAWFLGVIALVLSGLVVGYYFGYESAKEDTAKKIRKENQKQLNLPKKTEETAKKSETPSSESMNERLMEVLKKDVNVSEEKKEANVTKSDVQSLNTTKEKKEEIARLSPKELNGAAHEYGDESVETPPLAVQREVKKSTSNRPKLAIIIDDISTSAHVNALNSIGIKLTKSFLPPSNGRPNSAKLASQESQYMVHLPMEAQKFTAEEPFTLRIGDSQEDISKRIKELKVLFPKVKYINNHTGSKFTSDEAAMSKLMVALNENNISFVDSRTTGKSAVPKVMKNLGVNYLGRDVFLDHHMDKAYIMAQIKEAVRVAKKHGNAIAIGHPHANTILALSESKYLFNDIDLVYVDKID